MLQACKGKPTLKRIATHKPNKTTCSAEKPGGTIDISWDCEYDRRRFRWAAVYVCFQWEQTYVHVGYTGTLGDKEKKN